MTEFTTWQSFFYPDTYNTFDRQGTLRNKFGEKDFHVLRELEYMATADRHYELQQGSGGIARTFGAEHLQGIHQHLFQDLYEWAGEIRAVNMGKGGQVPFANARETGVSAESLERTGQIAQILRDVQEYVTDQNWGAMTRSDLVKHASVIFAYVNQAHPFREGNGRTSKVFMEHVAEQTPYTFDFARVDPDVWNHASEMSRPQNDRLWIDPTPLIPVFEQATQPRGYMLNRDTPQPTPEPHTLAERLAGRLKDLRAEQLNTHPLTPEAGHTHSGPSYGR